MSEVLGLNLKAWEQWLAYRKAIKKPLRPVSFELAQKKLASFGERQMEAVENSITNGWTGIFPPPKEKAEVERERRLRLEQILLSELKVRAAKVGFRDFKEGVDFVGGYETLVQRAEHAVAMSRQVSRGPQPIAQLIARQS